MHASARTSALASVFGTDRIPWLDAIRAAMPDDGCVAWDITMLSYAAWFQFSVRRPRTFLIPMGYGTLAFALPAAIGAKVGLGDQAVATVVCDGGFQFTMQKLPTVAQLRLRLPVIIFNDLTYSAVKLEQHTSREGRTMAFDLDNPDFTRLAEAITSALGRDLPTLIDAPIPGWV